MTTDPRVCPLLQEFAGWPGFPATPKPESYWTPSARDNAFKNRLDSITRLALRGTMGETFTAAFARELAATLVLEDHPYKPVEPEIADPADEELGG